MSQCHKDRIQPCAKPFCGNLNFLAQLHNDGNYSVAVLQKQSNSAERSQVLWRCLRPLITSQTPQHTPPPPSRC